MKNQLLKNISDEIQFSVFSEEENLGQLKVPWKKSVEAPNQWSLNQEHFFDNGSSLTVQLKFITHNAQ